jgi:hypothetical protein
METAGALLLALEFTTLRVAAWGEMSPSSLTQCVERDESIAFDGHSGARIAGGLSREGGNSVVEVTLMLPFIILLFLVLFNLGFYTYAALSTANAARVAALEIAAGGAPVGDVCRIVQREMRTLINTPFNEDGVCNYPPLGVTADDTLTDADGNSMVRVQVRYETVQLFPLPWMLGKMTFSREVDAREY